MVRELCESYLSSGEGDLTSGQEPQPSVPHMPWSSVVHPGNTVLSRAFREGRRFLRLWSQMCPQKDVSEGRAPLSAGTSTGSWANGSNW